MSENDTWQVGPLTMTSRVILGSSRYPNMQSMLDSPDASGTEMVTVALRRVRAGDDGGENLYALLKERHLHILPNTAGCYTVDDCVRTARLARELLGEERARLIKVEVIGDEKTLFPDVTATIAATKRLTDEGFVCLPYITDDPVSCLRLLDAGAAAVMPLAAPIGSGLGIRNPHNLQIILEVVRDRRPDVPVIVDAGVGVPSDAARAMEMGVDGVLMNTAIALAKDARLMAEAMRDGVRAGRAAFRAGRMPMKLYANASSPLDGLIHAR
jgi:thiazole synthase